MARGLRYLVIPMAIVTGCGSSTPATRSSTSTPTSPALSELPATPTASASAPPTAPAVLGTVAAATPSGTVAFVVVGNDATPRGPVTVTVAAASSNGHATVTGDATIPALASGATEAAMVRLAVPPDDTIGAVTSTASGAPADGAADPVTVTSAVFTPDAIEPTVDITVTSTVSTTAELVAACYQGATLIGGGVATTVSVAKDASTTFRLAAALSQTPTDCRGFAYRV